MMKNKIVGLIVLLALAVIIGQFFLSYQRITPYSPPVHQSLPIAPLPIKLTTMNNAPAIRSAEALLEAHFFTTPDVMPAIPAWIIQVTNFNSQTEAQTLLTELRSMGLDAFIFSSSLQGKKNFFVCAGPFIQQQRAIEVLSIIQERLKMTGLLKQYRVGRVNESDFSLISLLF